MRLVLLWVGATLLAVAAWPQPGFVGAERCKLCHRDVYESWRRTPHASTGASAIDADARCNACHTTDVRTRRLGVQCEACHGAGENYWPAEVMIDPDKASMAGLVQPTLAVCRRCHDPETEPETETETETETENDTENIGPDHRREFVIPSPAEWEASVHIRDEP